MEILRHERNRGKGAAILTAAAAARQQGMTHIATIDADGQHDPADLPRLAAVVEEDPTTLVVGHRDFSAANVPGASRFGRGFSNFWLRLQTGQSLGDTQSGFRIYPAGAFRRAHILVPALQLRDRGAGARRLGRNPSSGPADQRLLSSAARAGVLTSAALWITGG